MTPPYLARLGGSFADMGRCRLCWRITAAVFVAIVAVEAAILVFSVRNFERDRLAEVEREALVVMRSIIRAAHDAGGVETISEVGPMIRRNSVLVGARLLDSGGADVGRFGDAPSRPADVASTVAERWRSDEAGTLDVFWPAARLHAGHAALARVDITEIAGQVRAFVWRIIGLVLLISTFVTVVAMMILERLVLRPLRALRNGLGRIADNPERPDAHRLGDLGTDELAEVTTAFNGLTGRLAAAFGEIERQHVELEARNADLEDAVAARTSELRDAVDELRRRAAASEDQPATARDTDTLTGLASRGRFWDHCRVVMDQLDRNRVRGSVLYIDLDDFKKANEALGFEAGDRVLQIVAERIRMLIRKSDAAARISGDEFAVIQTNVDRDDQPAALAERIIERLSEPILVAGRSLNLDCSIGVSVFPNDGAEAETVIGNAILAMRRAKEAPQSTYRFYVPEMEQAAREARLMELDLRRALEAGELHVHYQPKLDTASGEIAAMEALLRWTHPRRGPVSPAVFIPVAERSRLIVEIGEWILREACRQTRKWNETAGRPFKVAVNLSPVQMRRGRVVDTVRRVLLETDLDPGRLELEITESAVMEDIDAARETLAALRQLGVSIAIDDFGTGYTSLKHLQDLPIDRIKIDRVFIKDIGTPAGDATIPKAILGIADSMGLTVTAEGVETEAQLAFLRGRGCHEVQGFYISRPLEERDFEAFALGRPALAVPA